jgi:hypothetical protein
MMPITPEKTGNHASLDSENVGNAAYVTESHDFDSPPPSIPSQTKVNIHSVNNFSSNFYHLIICLFISVAENEQ